MRQGRFQSWMIRNSPGCSKNGSIESTMTMSRSSNSAVPCRPCRSALEHGELGPAALGVPGGQPKLGNRQALHFAAHAAVVVGQADKAEVAAQVPTHHGVQPVHVFGAVLGAPLHAQHDAIGEGAVTAFVMAIPGAAADSCPSSGNPGIARSSAAPRSRRRRSGSAAAAWPRRPPRRAGGWQSAASQRGQRQLAAPAAALRPGWRCRWPSTRWRCAAPGASSSLSACSRSMSASAA